jgi:hypothetical protein
VAVACVLLVAAPDLAAQLAGAEHGVDGQRIGQRLRAAATPTAVTTPVDSLRVRSRARAAQRAFERTRRRHLPRTGRTQHYAGRCQEIVGRYCVWHDPDDPWTPPPDPPEVIGARARLLAELAGLAALAPGDRWIHGQRVRYLVEAGRLAEATEQASSCRLADVAWCQALLGFALHASGEDAGSEAAFDHAVAKMPEEERCRWTALEVLLGRDGRDYQELPCTERADWETRFWRLADPLYLVPGNSRRAEHFSRHVMDALQQDAVSGYNARWGRDLRELLVRYGWPAGWTRERRRHSGFRTEELITAHDAPEARQFEPPPDWVGRPDRASRGDWRLNPDRPRTLHAPRYAVFLDSLEHQLARFPRGDSVVLVAAYDLSRDTISACKSLEHGLFVANSRGNGRAAAMGRASGERGVLRAALQGETPVETGVGSPPADSSVASGYWVSLEVLCAADRWAARSRYGVGLAARQSDGLSLSDLLVLGNPGDGELPAKLAELLPLVLGTLRARSGERLALYWELNDTAGAGREVDVTVTLTRTDKGFFRKAVEWAGLARKGEEAVGLQWRERSDGSAISSRTVALDLPVLPEGTYRLSLRVSAAGGSLEASRVLRIIGVA